MKCTHCGKEIDDDSIFCEHCGEKQNITGNTPSGFVDLGLPSGTLWATCNVGATCPEQYGDYFAWGETSAKDSYTDDNYFYSGTPTTLPSNRDAAAANWGNGWRMPTEAEFNELLNSCTYKWTTQNGVNGCLFTGPNGNTIFLPAAGYRDDNGLNDADSGGYCWSSSLCTDCPGDAWGLDFGSVGFGMDDLYRCYGFSVRAVYQP